MALDFFAGCLGGCAGIVVGYPLDTVKVHIQTQDHRNPKYRGTWHCFRTLLAKDSVSGLYRGMSSPMGGVAVINAIVFGVYGQTQKVLSEQLPANGQHQLSGHFLAGASAGIAQAPVCSPIELAKTRLQLQESSSSSQRRFSGPLQCLRHIHRTEGLRGVFSGFWITLLREAPSLGVYFATYEALTHSDTPISTCHMLVAGGLAGTASWVMSYPIDVVKSRLQADVDKKYSGAVDCLRSSVRSEGYSCLFRGLNSTIIRAFPTNAATFAVVTWTIRLLSDGQPALPGESLRAQEVAEVFQPSLESWNALDRYGESSCHSLHALGDATEGYLRRLASTNLMLVPAHSSTAKDKDAAGCQFEETKEIIRY
ncbi:mitochondrial basic amino acids transporter [Phymastichus coffea]|uniref:mitochondrial basic amino acids transporter n=1 Tax=Phymastichus coffea TaxID=108790 RepID=UPI00273B5870|nr:mitochondrial basic amino acids transporter [Phymastichus coffea]